MSKRHCDGLLAHIVITSVAILAAILSVNGAKLETQIKLLINDDELLLQPQLQQQQQQQQQQQYQHQHQQLHQHEPHASTALDQEAHYNLYRSELKRLSYETIHRILRDENEPIYRREDAELRYYQKRSYQPRHELVRRSADPIKHLLNLSHSDLHAYNATQQYRSDFAQITEIDLSSNQLTQVSHLSKFTCLQKLNLSNNTLSQLPTLGANTTVEILNLNQNRIRKGTASANSHLRELHLSANAIDSLSTLNVTSLSALETLDLSCNQLRNLETAFFPQRMHNLRHLNLAHNLLDSVSRETFYNLLSLNTLLLSANNISEIDYETFLALPNLQYLDLSHNQLQGSSIRALQGIPDLMSLSIAYNPHVGAAMQEFVASWSLKELDASGTGLCQIPAALAQSVRTLKLTDNWLKIINCGDLDSYPLLQYLDLSHSHIEDIVDDALGRLEILEYLFLDHNLLRRVPQSLPTSLTHLFLQNNRIMDIQAQTFQGLNNLQTLDLSGNKLFYLPALPLPKLLILNVQSAKLKGVSQALVHTLPRLRDLLLEDNPIKCSDLLGIAEWASACRIAERTEEDTELNTGIVGQQQQQQQQAGAKIDFKLQFVQMHNFFEKFTSNCGLSGQVAAAQSPTVDVVPICSAATATSEGAAEAAGTAANENRKMPNERMTQVKTLPSEAAPRAASRATTPTLQATRETAAVAPAAPAATATIMPATAESMSKVATVATATTTTTTTAATATAKTTEIMTTLNAIATMNKPTKPTVTTMAQPLDNSNMPMTLALSNDNSSGNNNTTKSNNNNKDDDDDDGENADATKQIPKMNKSRSSLQTAKTLRPTEIETTTNGAASASAETTTTRRTTTTTTVGATESVMQTAGERTVTTSLAKQVKRQQQQLRQQQQQISGMPTTTTTAAAAAATIAETAEATMRFKTEAATAKHANHVAIANETISLRARNHQTTTEPAATIAKPTTTTRTTSMNTDKQTQVTTAAGAAASEAATETTSLGLAESALNNGPSVAMPTTISAIEIATTTTTTTTEEEEEAAAAADAAIEEVPQTILTAIKSGKEHRQQQQQQPQQEQQQYQHTNDETRSLLNQNNITASAAAITTATTTTMRVVVATAAAATPTPTESKTTNNAGIEIVDKIRQHNKDMGSNNNNNKKNNINTHASSLSDTSGQPATTATTAKMPAPAPNTNAKMTTHQERQQHQLEMLPTTWDPATGTQLRTHSPAQPIQPTQPPHKHEPLQLHIKDRHLIGTPLLMHKGENMLIDAEQFLLPGTATVAATNSHAHPHGASSAFAASTTMTGPTTITLTTTATTATTATTMTTSSHKNQMIGKGNGAAAAAAGGGAAAAAADDGDGDGGVTASDILAQSQKEDKQVRQAVQWQQPRQQLSSPPEAINVQTNTHYGDTKLAADNEQLKHKSSAKPTKTRKKPTLTIKKMTYSTKHATTWPPQHPANDRADETGPKHQHNSVNTPNVAYTRQELNTFAQLRELADNERALRGATTFIMTDMPTSGVMATAAESLSKSESESESESESQTIADAVQQRQQQRQLQQRQLSQSEQWLDTRKESNTSHHPAVMLLLSFGLIIVLLAGLMHVYRCDMHWRRQPHLHTRPHRRQFNDDDAHSFLHYQGGSNQSANQLPLPMPPPPPPPTQSMQRWHHSTRCQAPYSSPLHSLHVHELQRTSAIEEDKSQRCQQFYSASLRSSSAGSSSSCSTNSSSSTSTSRSTGLNRSSTSNSLIDEAAFYIEMTPDSGQHASCDMLPMELLTNGLRSGRRQQTASAALPAAISSAVATVSSAAAATAQPRPRLLSNKLTPSTRRLGIW